MSATAGSFWGSRVVKSAPRMTVRSSRVSPGAPVSAPGVVSPPVSAGVSGPPQAARDSAMASARASASRRFMCVFLLFCYISAMMSSAVRFFTRASRSSHHALS